MANQNIEVLLDNYANSLKAFAYSFTKNADDAQDLYQDTLLKAVRYFQMYKPNTNLRAWLFTIMRNTFINDYRRCTRRNAIMQIKEEFTPQELAGHCSQNQALGNFMMRDIDKMLNILPDCNLVPFKMHFEGYKYHEIAEHLDIPLGTVKTRIHQAREILKQKLKPYAR